ncbi:hypothetical protein Nepgr_009423 [Nepenthes gracilis]|uniref:Uncharacterized protein n=1 Tax=Nepenthes gracilis TaxID=150966 RepID=A0AAD3SAJ4_NEPGR|nr:hypothetical protein Nepgr_009423 [Nepenthes gracilis]
MVEPMGELDDNNALPIQNNDLGENQSRRKRPHRRSSIAYQQSAPSRNVKTVGETRSIVPDINHSDARVVEYEMHEIQKENGIVEPMIPINKGLEGQPQIFMPGQGQFNHFLALSEANLMSTQTNLMSTRDLHVGGRSLLHPSAENANLQGATYVDYNPPLEYGFRDDDQLPHIAINESQVSAELAGFHLLPLNRSENDTAGGDFQHYSAEPFHAKMDSPIESHFGPPINGLSLDFGNFDSPFNLAIDGTGSIDDLLGDDDILQYFGAF